MTLIRCGMYWVELDINGDPIDETAEYNGELDEIWELALTERRKRDG